MSTSARSGGTVNTSPSSTLGSGVSEAALYASHSGAELVCAIGVARSADDEQEVRARRRAALRIDMFLSVPTNHGETEAARRRFE